jgi:MFS family permease
MYRSTIKACYIGNFVGALMSNLAPLLYILFIGNFGITFEQAGRLTLINFFTQIVADLAFSRPVDRHGVRPFIALGHACVFVGFLLMAGVPVLFARHPYFGLMIATVVYSCGGGLLELLLSAIIQAIPSDAKASAMSLLHSFYAWGFIAVVVGTTLMLSVFGEHNWQVVVLLWSLLPLINFINFLRVPLAPQVAEEHRTGTRVLLRSPYFLAVVAGIAFGGATEVSMSQWTSAFVEASLNLPKAVGDLAGLCLFAAFLGTGRAIYGKSGHRIDVSKVMLAGSLFTIGCYLVAALSPWPLVSLAACAMCGLGTSLLWPGSVVNAADRFPLAGASLFALLAAGGDTGAAVGPWLVGLVADINPTLVKAFPWLSSLSDQQTALRSGMLFATIYPVLMVGALLAMRHFKRKEHHEIPLIE